MRRLRKARYWLHDVVHAARYDGHDLKDDIEAHSPRLVYIELMLAAVASSENLHSVEGHPYMDRTYRHTCDLH